MDRELRYLSGNASLHTHDYANLSEYLRQSSTSGDDVPSLSNTQTLGVNHQRGLEPHVRITRGYGTRDWLGHPGQRN